MGTMVECHNRNMVIELTLCIVQLWPFECILKTEACASLISWFVVLTMTMYLHLVCRPFLVSLWDTMSELWMNVHQCRVMCHVVVCKSAFYVTRTIDMHLDLWKSLHVWKNFWIVLGYRTVIVRIIKWCR